MVHFISTNLRAGVKYGENTYENSAKKTWKESWTEYPDRKFLSRTEDDGFGHKSQEAAGKGTGEDAFEYSDKTYENVATQERRTEKQGFSASDCNKWNCKIIDTPESNYVENVGENWKTTDKWIEKWHDNKRGIN